MCKANLTEKKLNEWHLRAVTNKIIPNQLPEKFKFLFANFLVLAQNPA
jgi:hypothetical protein